MRPSAKVLISWFRSFRNRPFSTFAPANTPSPLRHSHAPTHHLLCFSLGEVSKLVRTSLIHRTKDFNIEVDDVAITDLSYGAEFSKAVEEKQVAQQETELSKFVVAKAEQECRAAIIKAEGESESAKLISDATSVAGPGLIELRKIEATKHNAATLLKNGNVTYLPIRIMFGLFCHFCTF